MQFGRGRLLHWRAELGLRAISFDAGVLSLEPFRRAVIKPPDQLTWSPTSFITVRCKVLYSLARHLQEPTTLFYVRNDAIACLHLVYVGCYCWTRASQGTVSTAAVTARCSYLFVLSTLLPHCSRIPFLAPTFVCVLVGVSFCVSGRESEINRVSHRQTLAFSRLVK